MCKPREKRTFLGEVGAGPRWACAFSTADRGRAGPGRGDAADEPPRPGRFPSPPRRWAPRRQAELPIRPSTVAGGARGASGGPRVWTLRAGGRAGGGPGARTCPRARWAGAPRVGPAAWCGPRAADGGAVWVLSSGADRASLAESCLRVRRRLRGGGPSAQPFLTARIPFALFSPHCPSDSHVLHACIS